MSTEPGHDPDELAVEWERRFRRLWEEGRGRPLDEVLPLVADLDALAPESYRRDPSLRASQEMHAQCLARVVSDPAWLRRHPADSLRLARRHRGVRRPWATLRWLARPRFAG